MAIVVLPPALRAAVEGSERVQVKAKNIRELMSALKERFPLLEEALDAGPAVSIDGEIIADPFLEKLEPDSEVHFLPQIGGG